MDHSTANDSTGSNGGSSAINMLDYALAYQRFGAHVIPLGRNKRPPIKWEEFQDRPATEVEIRGWWAKWPEANIGFVTGEKSGLLVIDIESVKGLEAYKEKYGVPGKTLMQRTGKPNGVHLLKKHPRDGRVYQNQVKALPDVDTRGDGGYIMVAPSVHPNGKRYVWAGSNPIDDGGFFAITELEPGVDTLFNPLAKGEQKGKKRKHESAKDRKNPEGWILEYLEGVDEGQRNDWAAKLAGYFLRQHDGDVTTVKVLMRQFNERNRPPLDWKELDKTIESIASRHGTSEMGGAVGEEIEKIEILAYPDGQRKYNVYLTGQDGYAQMSLIELGMFSKFKWRFGELAGYIPKTIKQDVWEKKVNKALDEAETIDVKEDETPLGMIIAAIDRAIAAKDRASDPSFIGRRILIMGDNGNRKIYLTISTLLSTVKFEGEKVTRRLIGAYLRQLGFNNNASVQQDDYADPVRCWWIDYDVFVNRISKGGKC